MNQTIYILYQLITSAGESLSKAERIRLDLKESYIKIHEISQTVYLSDFPKLIEAIQPFVWAVSANFEGNIKSSELEITQTQPYVKLEGEIKLKELLEFKENLMLFIKTTIEGPAELKTLIQSVSDVYGKLQGEINYESNVFP